MIKALTCVVIGAGICGLSTAIWLRRAGHEVTLIDREGPGAGASYGNAGLLAQWAIIPVNTPDLPKHLPGYLLNRHAPLFMDWAYLPRMIPWLMTFMRNANAGVADRTISNLAMLLGDSVDQHSALVRGTGAEKWVTSSDFTYVYESRKAFEKDSYSWEKRREHGFVPELIEGRAVQEAEPILADNIQLLARLKSHGHIVNPGAYMADLADVFQQEGGTYLQAEARDFEMREGRVISVLTDHGALPCDHAVITTGIWSKPLAKKLGVKIPLEAERGYHLHFKNPSIMPNTPMMHTSGKFGVNPMESGLRCAGTVELGGITKGPSKAPFDLIGAHVARTFPKLEYDGVEEWMGFRPSTPDSLPMIGEFGQSGIYAGFGHQHIGLTAGPKTGRWIADLISGRKPNLDLSAYDTARF